MKRQAKIGLGEKINILGLGIPLGDVSSRSIVCPKCGRRHSGLCGIPGTVTGHTPSAGPGVTPRPKRKSSTPIYPIKIEPSYDVFEESSQIKVILNIPGVEEKEIKIFLEDKTIKVTAERRDRNYYKTEIELKTEVKPEFSKKYHNGILTIILEVLEKKE